MSMDYKISLKKRAGVLAASVGKEIISPTGRFGNTAFHTSNLSNVTIDLNRTTMTKNTTLEIFTETNERSVRAVSPSDFFRDLDSSSPKRGVAGASAMSATNSELMDFYNSQRLAATK